MQDLTVPLLAEDCKYDDSMINCFVLTGWSMLVLASYLASAFGDKAASQLEADIGRSS